MVCAFFGMMDSPLVPTIKTFVTILWEQLRPIKRVELLVVVILVIALSSGRTIAWATFKTNNSLKYTLMQLKRLKFCVSH